LTCVPHYICRSCLLPAASGRGQSTSCAPVPRKRDSLLNHMRYSDGATLKLRVLMNRSITSSEGCCGGNIETPSTATRMSLRCTSLISAAPAMHPHRSAVNPFSHCLSHSLSAPPLLSLSACIPIDQQSILCLTASLVRTPNTSGKSYTPARSNEAGCLRDT
jgi:hypothetical protein